MSKISKSIIDWCALAERVPAAQKPQYQSFKSKSDIYLRNVLANPAQPPKLDWAMYQKKIPNASLVAEFKKNYEAFKIPYPEDKMASALDSQAAQTTADIERFINESCNRIGDFKSEIEKIQSLVPYEQMTWEDYREAFPDKALDAISRPTFWPHDEEEQKPMDPAAGGHH